MITASIRAAVVKSGFLSARRMSRIWEKSKPTSRSTRAPAGISPEVGTPSVTVSASPSATTPPAMIAPCATAYIWPSAAFSGVITSVPPSRLEASPIAETVTSTWLPARENGGSAAVTSTAATLRARICSPVTLTPSRSSRLTMASSVNGEFRKLSPELLRPTTRP